MKEILLTQEKKALIDDEDYDLVSQYTWWADFHKGQWRAATRRRGEKTIYMARLIMGTPDGFDTDHIDRNGLNNQKSNLRIATRGQNSINSRPRGGTSHFKGVSFDAVNKKWRASITICGKRFNLGRYISEIDAALAYDAAARNAFGEFAYTNYSNRKELQYGKL